MTQKNDNIDERNAKQAFDDKGAGDLKTVPEASYRFFQNKRCEYFPCHKTERVEEFNCLFCFCPLYALGEGCNGNYEYTADGTKDCSNCLIPHSPGGYDYILSRFPDLAALSSRKK